ncbi:flavin reductase [Streptomyces mirabilis]|uniref:flavin reductase n=1 Tax=Streptomyces mirabilis TaxID=68239 RepID=UPI0037B53449
MGYDDGLTSVAGAWLECRMVDRIPAGDHRIVLAAPVRGGHGGRDQSRPLLYHDRRYTSVTEPKEGTKPRRSRPGGSGAPRSVGQYQSRQSVLCGAWGCMRWQGGNASEKVDTSELSDASWFPCPQEMCSARWPIQCGGG